MRRQAIQIVRNVSIGAVLGAALVLFAARGGAKAIHLDWTIWGAVGGAVLALIVMFAPRLFRGPKDWPTLEEFRHSRAQPNDRRKPDTAPTKP